MSDHRNMLDDLLTRTVRAEVEEREAMPVAELAIAHDAQAEADQNEYARIRADEQRRRLESHPAMEAPAVTPPAMRGGRLAFPAEWWLITESPDWHVDLKACCDAFEAHIARLSTPSLALLATQSLATIAPTSEVMTIHPRPAFKRLIASPARLKICREALRLAFGSDWTLAIADVPRDGGVWSGYV